jgi:hypothetical protein
MMSNIGAQWEDHNDEKYNVQQEEVGVGEYEIGVKLLWGVV